MRARLVISSLGCCSFFTLNCNSKQIMTAKTNTNKNLNSNKNLYNTEAYLKPVAKERPFNEVDYRSRGGPKLTYLWPHDDEALVGQTLYLGGEVGSDGKVYFIPGHAPRVLQLDPETDILQQIGPVLSSKVCGSKFKYLRGVRVGDIIYGLPCHADSVLRINVPTGQITTIDIPYEEFFNDDPQKVQQQRRQEWKYHGGNTSPIDGCIYAIPQSASHVLKIDPASDTCTLVGPELPGRWKWYGGVIGKQDGAIYGIPHDAANILRIHPLEGVTLHGDYELGGHKWHGASAAPDGTIVCVPANADTVLCIAPGSPEPALYEIGDASIIKTGRHRKDTKYKFLGAMTGPDGAVYIFPSGSEFVLRVDTVNRRVQNIGPNIYDSQIEIMCQNKWQNGLVDEIEKCVYGIPLAAESLLRIDCSKGHPIVSTWPLPAPFKGLGKFEGGVVAPNGILYTVPNNHKAVLRIEPAIWEAGRSQEEVRSQCKYRGGICTMRSSAHRVKYSPKTRTQNPRPKNRQGEETNTIWLPEGVCAEDIFDYDTSLYDLTGALRGVLQACDRDIVGYIREGSDRLEDFVVPVPSLWRKVNGGQCETAQKYLSDQIASDPVFLDLFDSFVKGAVLPYLKKRLIEAGVASNEENSVTFYYQRPPTIRIQPGPGWAIVKPHNDAEYGHQYGELNFWVPFTDRGKTGVDFWCESKYQADDYRPLPAKPGQVVAFHGSSCRHYVNANKSDQTRVSMDFRVGVEGFFDPYWQMKGTTDDHGRKEVQL